MNIAIVYSPNWSHYAAIEVYAIFATNPPPITIYAISDTGGEFKVRNLRDGYTVMFINLENLFADKIPSTVNVDGRFTKYALYRLLLPDVIQEDRVLYLDADTIVNGDIAGFYNMDLGDNFLAGVSDSGILDSQKATIGLSPADTYINAGVTLMDLDKIRAAGLPELWLKEINARWYSCHDQDVINMTCKERIKLVDLKYNASLSTGLDIQADEIKIMHYAGIAETKPWCSDKAPFYQIWKAWADRYARENT